MQCTLLLNPLTSLTLFNIKMSSDILAILIGRITDKTITEEKKIEISKRLNSLKQTHAATAARMIVSYKARYDGKSKVIGQQEGSIPYSGKQLDEGAMYHNKMIPDQLFLALEQLIIYIDSDK